MPWICRNDAGGYPGTDDDLSDEEWEILEKVLHEHNFPIIESDASGAQVRAKSIREMEALGQALNKAGFDWVNGDWRESS